ncbi:MAG: hypothetical protein PHU04_00985 [Candidatus Peribacteraceae bacterium]|nr:hypothetical protein [Candidatus Peribacteraceae bacterium]
MPTAEPLRTPEADEAQLIQSPQSPGEQAIDQRRVNWRDCLAGAVNQEAMRVGPAQEEWLTTAETAAVIADAQESLALFFHDGARITHRDLQRVAAVCVRHAEEEKKRGEHSSIR